MPIGTIDEAIDTNRNTCIQLLRILFSGLLFVYYFLLRSGIVIGGKHYKVRLADGRHGILARTDRDGCTVCKTRTLMIIGIHDDRGVSARCNEEVMRLGDFLRRKAF